MPKKPKPTKRKPRRLLRSEPPRISEQTQEPVATEGTVSGPFTDDPLGTEDDEAADDEESFDPYETP